jgi:hypothetical protein
MALDWAWYLLLKSDSTETFRLKVSKLLVFHIRVVVGHYIVAFSGELGNDSNGSNEPGEFWPQRPILSRMLILDDMHWK